MLIPYQVDVPLARWPWENWLLIAATCLGAFVFMLDPDQHEHWAILYRDEADFAPIQIWGSLIGHAGLMHLAGNMVALFVFGNAVNAKFSWFYLPIYAVIALGEGLTWLAVGDGPATLGASGAVYGVMGAFLVFFPRNDVSVFYWFLARVGTFSVSAFWIMLLYVGMDLVFMSTGKNSGTNHLAHVSGFAIGFAIALGACIAGFTPSEGYEQSLWDIMRGRGAGGEEKEETKKQGRLLDKYGEGRRPRSPRGSEPSVNVTPIAPVACPVYDDSPIPLAGDEPAPAPRPKTRPVSPQTSGTIQAKPRPRPPGNPGGPTSRG